MPQRDNLFRKFGPLQNEGLLLLSLEGINALRVKAGLTAYTAEQAMTRLDEILSNLESYDWMNETP